MGNRGVETGRLGKSSSMMLSIGRSGGPTAVECG